MKTILFVLLIIVLTVQEDANLLDEFSVSMARIAEMYYTEIKQSPGNLLICPISLYYIQVLGQVDFHGTSPQVINNVLNAPYEFPYIEPMIRKVNQNLHIKEEYAINLDNNIYVGNGFAFHETFENIAVNVFDSKIQNIDFEKRKETTSVLNKLVMNKTNLEIQSILTEIDFNDHTPTLILNTMYFNGKWLNEFNKEDTTQEPFYLTKSLIRNVDMMQQTSYFDYYEDSDLHATFLQLRYRGNSVSMTIISPNSDRRLEELETHMGDLLTPREFVNRSVCVRLPKFTIHSTFNFNALAKKIRNSDRPRFSKLEEVLEDTISLNRLLHVTSINVNEEGTVAATGTAALTEIRPTFSSSVEFNANRPFIFYLKHDDIGIFYIGRYYGPDGEISVVDLAAQLNFEENREEFVIIVEPDYSSDQ